MGINLRDMRLYPDGVILPNAGSAGVPKLVVQIMVPSVNAVHKMIRPATRIWQRGSLLKRSSKREVERATLCEKRKSWREAYLCVSNGVTLEAHLFQVWRALIGRLLQKPGWRFFGRDYDDVF